MEAIRCLMFASLQLLQAVSCQVQNIKRTLQILSRYSMILCFFWQLCEWLPFASDFLVLNGARQRSVRSCALSSWRRLDSCGQGKDETTLKHF